MRQIITDDFGAVKVGNVLLPGIFQELSIEGGINTDNISIENQSGTSKQPQGFKDATISLTLNLPTDDADTCYDKLARITAILQNVDAQAKPYIYDIVNKHTAIWKIKKVVFESLISTEDNRDDIIRAILNFREFRPVVVNNESRRKQEAILPANIFQVPKTPVAQTTKQQTVYEDYIWRYQQGKKAETPAKDDDFLTRFLKKFRK